MLDMKKINPSLLMVNQHMTFNKYVMHGFRSEVMVLHYWPYFTMEALAPGSFPDNPLSAIACRYEVGT